MLGTSGNACDRILLVTASARSLPSLTWGTAGGNDVERDRRMPGKRRADRQARAVEWDVHEVEAKRQAEMLADEMRRRPGARRGVAVFAWVGCDQCDEVPDRLDRQRWMHRRARLGEVTAIVTGSKSL